MVGAFGGIVTITLFFILYGISFFCIISLHLLYIVRMRSYGIDGSAKNRGAVFRQLYMVIGIVIASFCFCAGGVGSGMSMIFIEV